MAALNDLTVTVHVDTSEVDALEARMCEFVKVAERTKRMLDEVMRPWWCPLWLFRVVNGGK